MYTLTDMTRTRATLGALPAILTATLAVGSAAMLAAVLTASDSDAAHTLTTPELAPRPGVVAASTITPDPAPARDVITELLPNPRWGATVPVPFGCQVTAPMLSAQDGPVSVHVFSAGLGQVVADQVAQCGTPTGVGSTNATRLGVDGGTVTAWTRGDVLVTLTSPGPPGVGADQLDAALLDTLGGTCANLTPSLVDATRNPTRPDYAPYTQVLTLTTNPTPGAPDVGDELPAPAPAPATVGVPDGVAGPPVPDPVPEPAPPSWPGPEPLTIKVVVPAADITGPGCGWAFTDSVPPPVDLDAVQVKADALRQAAADQLTSRQQTWLTDAQQYTDELVEYVPALQAWTDYVTAVDDVHQAWSRQAAELDAYRADLATWQAAQDAAAEHLARQDEAQRDYDQTLAGCAEETDTGQEDITAEHQADEPSSLCDVPRPAILDQASPPVPPEPTPPVLWAP